MVIKVLVVDDSMLNLQFVKEYLSKVPEIDDIILCEDSVQVQKIVEKVNIDLIILDVIMPTLSGFDILKILRSDVNYNAIPIIMLTSLTDRESFVKCFELGANDYITKPIQKDEFFARINVAMHTRKNYLELKKLVGLTAQQNQELKEINTKLMDAKNSLMQAEKMSAIGQLAAGIAHELNNPLGYVNNNFEILKKYCSKIIEYQDFVKEQLAELVLPNSIVKQIDERYHKLKLPIIRDDIDPLFSESFSGLQRMADIILSLRIFAHSDVGVEKSLNPLNEMMNQLLLICKNEAKYIAEIKTHIDDGLMIFGNKIQLAQVFMNMILNSIQAIESQQKDMAGHIVISATKENDYIDIHISDDGPGIPESDLNKIFEPFFTTKEIGKGTGLGLSIAYDIIVVKHNGHIECKSEVGFGTEFIIKLPIIDEKESL